jgi:hypothetical protein
MTRSVHRFAAVVVVIASCGNEPAPRTGCDVYVDALEECLVELGLPVDPGLRRRVGCGAQTTPPVADAYFDCMAGALRDGSCALDGREDPLLYLSRDLAACHPRPLVEGDTVP